MVDRQVESSDLIEQKVHVGYIQEGIRDFESRIRELESFKNQQIGFFKSNKHWITIGLVSLLNLIMNLIFK